MTVCAGVIRVWDLIKGKMSHSLEPLPRPQTGSERTASGEGGEGGEGREGEGEEVPQVYTDLQVCVSRGDLVGVTYDHSILFYDLATFNRQKQVSTKHSTTDSSGHGMEVEYTGVVYNSTVVYTDMHVTDRFGTIYIPDLSLERNVTSI